MPYKGYGFILGDDGTKLFVYNGALVNGSKLEVGARVTYDIGQHSNRSQKEDGVKPAVNVSGPGVTQNCRGAMEGTVKVWLAPKSCGFIIVDGDEEKVYYVHHSAFEGARLKKGETVYFDDLPERVHETGRGVAVNVTGPGVCDRGVRKGTVRRWSAENRYGFILDEDTREDVFVHGNELGGCSLVVGKGLFYDVEKGSDGRNFAHNVSGPAIIAKDDNETEEKKSPTNRGKGGKSSEKVEMHRMPHSHHSHSHSHHNHHNHHNHSSSPHSGKGGKGGKGGKAYYASHDTYYPGGCEECYYQHQQHQHHYHEPHYNDYSHHHTHAEGYGYNTNYHRGQKGASSGRSNRR